MASLLPEIDNSRSRTLAIPSLSPYFLRKKSFSKRYIKAACFAKKKKKKTETNFSDAGDGQALHSLYTTSLSVI